MTSEITAAKQEFAAALTTAGIRVLDYVPDRITPPIVIVNAASPYIATAEFGEYYLNLELVLVGATGTNKEETYKLDQLIEDVLLAIEPLGYVKLRKEQAVSQPYELQTNNAGYLSANIYVQLAITL